MFRFWEQPSLQESTDVSGGGAESPKQETHDSSQKNENVVEQEEMKRRAEVSSMIAEPEMRKRYIDRNGFEKEMKETHQKFEVFLKESFEEKNPELFRELRGFLEGESNKKVVELLTLVRLYGDSYKPDLYHEELFRHSLGVFRIVAEAYGDVAMMNGGGASASFRLDGSIAEEMGKRSDSESDCKDARLEMLLSALVHDAGKITLPEEIVYNSVTNEESIDAVRDAVEESSDIPLEMAQTFKRFRNHWKDFPSLPDDFLKEEEGKGEQKKVLWKFVRNGKRIRVFLSEELRKSILSWLPKKEKNDNGEKSGKEKEKRKELRVNPFMSVGILLEAEVKEDMKKAIASGTLKEEAKEDFLREETRKRIEKLAKLNPLIDPSASLEEVLRLHEERSGTLVRIMENSAIRESLVSHHHNYNHELPHIFSLSQAGDSHVQMMKFFQTYNIPSDINESLAGTVANRLMALCDVFEALGSDRSYKKPMPFGQILVYFVNLARRERVQYEQHREMKKKKGEPMQKQQEEHERQGLGIITRFIEHKIRIHERDSGVKWEDDTTVNKEDKQFVNDFLEEEKRRVTALLKSEEEK